MKSSLQIKQALIQIAERNGRPPYELYFVKQVIAAIRSGADHPMRAAVEAEQVTGEIVAQSSPKTRLDKLIDFCAPRGMRALLARNSGLSFSYLSQSLTEPTRYLIRLGRNSQGLLIEPRLNF